MVKWMIENEKQNKVGQYIPPIHRQNIAFLNDAYHRDIGTPESLQTAEREYLWHPAA